MALAKEIRLWLTLAMFVVYLLGENNMRSSHAIPLSVITKDGDVIIQGMFPLTNSKGKLMGNYVVAMEAMIYAIKNINERKDILPRTKLGYEIIDNKGENLHIIMEHAIRIVSTYRPRSVCRADEEFCEAGDNRPSALSKRVSVLIGPANSGTTVPVASLLGLYHIPQIGYSASSSLLSKKTSFKSFLRTIPSDKYQAEAMASFVNRHKWNYVIFIGSDDEYGRQGLSSFKEAARKLKVCTANDVNIAFQSEDSETLIRNAVKTINDTHRAKVVVVFMFETQLARLLKEVQKQGLTNITWILSDGIGRTILNYNINKELLHGAFAVDFIYTKVTDFDAHLRNITVQSSKGNPWMMKLLEKALECSTSLPAGQRKCRDDEKLNLSRAGISNNWSGFVNVINGVTAIAHGLDNLLNCTNGHGLLEGGRCPNKTLPVEGEDLYKYIQKASFVGAMNKTVAFDDNGDLVTKEYIFRNLVFDREKDTLDFRTVAKWSSESTERLSFSGVPITWNQDEQPVSTCSRPCVPGEKQVGQSDCCWACQPCPKGEISNSSIATVCTKCPEDSYANEKQTKCLKIGVDFVKASDSFSIVIMTVCCLGLVAMAAVALLFVYFRDTPLIQDSRPVLLGLFVLTASLAFIFSMFQVSLYRYDSACRFLGAFLPYVLLLLGVTLLAKTKTCDRLLRMFTSHFKAANQHCSLIMILASLVLQLLFIGIWFLTDTPVVQVVKDTEAMHLRQCNTNWSAARFIATGFPLFVLFVATIFAFKERDNRTNHSEAKYMSFCTISLCILLIAFFPTYRFVKGITTTIVIATTSIIGAFAVIGCIILPKVYILIWRPDSNVPEHERSSDPTVSSAHTAGSHPGSSGHHHSAPSQCAETGEQLRGANDIDLSSSTVNSPRRNVVHVTDNNAC